MTSDAPQAGVAFHGGAFFEAIGDDFRDLGRRHRVVNADVLDAWFAPTSAAIASLHEHLEWLMRTSPPTHAEGLLRAIASSRGVPIDSLVVGAGSSALIFAAFRSWLSPESRALILDPSYGEYSHVLEQVIGCHVDRHVLSRAQDYAVDLEALAKQVATGYDLLVIVNPNNPTGRHIPRSDLEQFLLRVPQRTRVWVDEAYIDYVDSGESVEAFAAHADRVVVCKSMSKGYGLSGLRVGYLCTGADTAAQLRRGIPPWAVSLPAQVAAVSALRDSSYYASCYEQTRALRDEMFADLLALGVSPVPGVANFLLFHLPQWSAEAEVVAARTRELGVFVRVAGRTSETIGSRALRTAVKDRGTNRVIINALREAIGTPDRLAMTGG